MIPRDPALLDELRSRLFAGAGLTDSAESWRTLIDLRNTLIHDYSEDSEQQLQKYVAARDAVMDLNRLFEKLDRYIEAQALLSNEGDVP